MKQRLRLVVGVSFSSQIEDVLSNTIYALAACVFFPENAGVDPHLFTFAIFAGAFMMRIIGGLLFGYIGDKCGRRNALFTSILLMSISTTLMGCLPTFALLGFAAPIMLFLVRLCQGLSVGGQVCFMPDACAAKKNVYTHSSHAY